jgi:hypothetical protein
VQVRHDEGVAIRVDPEPCTAAREGRGEASVGARAGQPSSRESHSFRVPTLLIEWKATRAAAPSQVAIRPGVVEDPGMYARSLHGNREVSRPAGPPQAVSARIGKARSRSR